ncbi:MAG: GH92 family glycosyl hydrolase, partial [Bacteroidales bacterium]|nr:GH92 family glycosyl hydrolase [Bacteroidales bacterium]
MKNRTISAKTLLLTVLTALTVCASAATPATPGTEDLKSARSRDLTQFVNPLAGTQSTYELSAGNTYPAIARPWGMNFWTPQTGRNGDGWQYVYTANIIRGFKQTHQPSPWINDYGQFSLMPMVGAPEFDENNRGSWFSHKGEVALPYYYKVYLADYDVVTEFTPTERACLFRFTFPETENAYVVTDAFDRGSYIRIEPERNRIIGYSTRNSKGVPDNFRNYFIIEFDKPFTYTATVADRIFSESRLERKSGHTLAIVGFETAKGEQIHARVASSFISFEQAELNLGELGDDSFETLVQKGRDAWNSVLSRIEILPDIPKDGNINTPESTHCEPTLAEATLTTDRLKTFYSCLYRALLFPRMLYEIDAEGNPVHYSPYNGEVLPGYMYTDTGFWDTFRSLFPLLNLLYPSRNLEIQEGLLNAYRESGFFPEWASPGHRDCMIGNNSASVLADAWLKGVKVSDPETLYEGLVHGTENTMHKVSSTGRLGWRWYNDLGYVPYDVDINESAARTLEYAYDDWCIWRVAKDLGRPKKEVSTFAERALNYRNVFDPESKLMRGRNADGSFQSPFSPLKWGDAFTEGNSWHYTWSVFHDSQGLADLMGGREIMAQMLDSVFTVPPLYDESYYGQVIHEIREMTVMNMGNYAHGNQPIQHMIYLYDYVGRPWKAQYWTRRVMDTMYSAAPDAYCGDEDNGQTSAWYVFSALGFYPVCPGTDQYILGSPLFRNALLHFENGNTLQISA